MSTSALSLIGNCRFSVRTIGAPAAAIFGDGTLLEGNVFDSWVYVGGNHNMIARNILRGNLPNVIEINGTGNIGSAIDFKASGNIYGNNRIALPGGITGADGNVDWGGNATY